VFAQAEAAEAGPQQLHRAGTQNAEFRKQHAKLQARREAKTRTCLRCGNPFRSTRPANRVCRTCQRHDKNVAVVQSPTWV
jgi:hypothetical protein